MSISNILAKIDALIAETEAYSVSPAIVGNLMRDIVDALSTLKTGVDSGTIDGLDDILAFLSGCSTSETLIDMLNELKTRLSNVENLSTTVTDVVAEVEALGDAVVYVDVYEVVDNMVRFRYTTRNGRSNYFVLTLPVDSLASTVDTLSESVDLVRDELGALAERVEDERILPFAGIVYSLSDVTSPYDGQIVFVESLGHFRKYSHESWDFDATVSPYNLSTGGIVIPNSTRLFRLAGSGSLYRKALTGNRLESVAWSDESVTHDQLSEATDALSEAISDTQATIAELRAEISDGVVVGDVEALTTDEIDAALE